MSGKLGANPSRAEGPTIIVQNPVNTLPTTIVVIGVMNLRANAPRAPLRVYPKPNAEKANPIAV